MAFLNITLIFFFKKVKREVFQGIKMPAAESVCFCKLLIGFLANSQLSCVLSIHVRDCKCIWHTKKRKPTTLEATANE